MYHLLVKTEFGISSLMESIGLAEVVRERDENRAILEIASHLETKKSFTRFFVVNSELVKNQANESFLQCISRKYTTDEMLKKLEKRSFKKSA